MSRPGARAVLVLLLCGAASTAHAVPLVRGLGGTLGFGTQCLGPNDDGSSAPIDLSGAFPTGLNFFGTTFHTVHVNTNGNVSFGGAVSAYTPRAFPVASRPMIAPYWADVDIRGEADRCARRGGAMSACQNPSDNGVWWDLSPGRLVVTWHRVGYYECHTDKIMSFQLILTEVPGSSCGIDGADFDVEMRYARCQWTTGDASGGRDGFGGTEAQAGFDAGNGTDFVMLPRSRTDRIHTRLCNGTNAGEAGVWRFQIRNGAVICPDAGAACETGMPGVCGAGRVSCVGEGTACVSEVEPAPERCNALDDDCDGSVDEGSEICGGGFQVCDRGACIEPCFEGGCADGTTCDSRGVCVEATCEGVTCGDSERCEAGACVDACAGVTCPLDRECRAGRCVDACASLDCGACGACDAGACVPRCEPGSCPAGSECADGLCVPTACAACPAGTACRDGACVDACAGAACPSGERCELGECLAIDESAPPPPPPPGGEPDASRPPPVAPDAGVDAPPTAPPPPTAGGCSIGGRADAGLAWLALAAALALLRRRSFAR